MYQVTIVHNQDTTRIALSDQYDVHRTIEWAIDNGFGVHVKKIDEVRDIGRSQSEEIRAMNLFDEVMTYTRQSPKRYAY